MVPLSVGAKRLGMRVRALMQEIEMGDLIGKQRPSGVYVNVEQLRAYLGPKVRR